MINVSSAKQSKEITIVHRLAKLCFAKQERLHLSIFKLFRIRNESCR